MIILLESTSTANSTECFYLVRHKNGRLLLAQLGKTIIHVCALVRTVACSQFAIDSTKPDLEINVSERESLILTLSHVGNLAKPELKHQKGFTSIVM